MGQNIYTLDIASLTEHEVTPASTPLKYSLYRDEILTAVQYMPLSGTTVSAAAAQLTQEAHGWKSEVRFTAYTRKLISSD